MPVVEFKGICHADPTFSMACVGISQNNLLQIQHQCYSFPLYASLILPEPISLLFSSIAAFIAFSYYGYTEVCSS